MSQLSKLKHSRDQWKHKATQRGERERYQRKQTARIRAERDRAIQDLKETQARLRQMEARGHGLAIRPKVDVVYLALQLFLEARLGFRAVSRVLTLLALALGITRAPCPQTIINWVMRLSIVRIDAVRTLRGVPLSQAPFTNGLIWMIDISIGLGTGKILAVLAVDAHHHQRAPDALALHDVHCIGVCVADSWTGDAIAEVLKHLIAQLGRPAAYLKDGGSELHRPSSCWPNNACSARASTISHTRSRGCSSALTNTTPPLSGLCRPAGGFRASSSTPSWHVWRRPPCALKLAL